jgi:hypothetical protein
MVRAGLTGLASVLAFDRFEAEIRTRPPDPGLHPGTGGLIYIKPFRGRREILVRGHGRSLQGCVYRSIV